MSRKQFDTLVEKHIVELEGWIAEDPSRWDDPDRTIREYCQEYSDRFSITADVASDLDYPRADEMLDELRPFEEWFA